MLPPSDPSPENEAQQPPVAQPVQLAGAASSGPAVAVATPKPRVKAKAKGKRLVRRAAPGGVKPATARPATPRPAGATTPRPPEDDEPESFFQRFGKFIIIGGLVVAVGVWLATKKSSPSGPAPKQERIVMIAPLPPLPPPPPPPPHPPQQKPPEEKMEKETAPVEEAKPVAKPDPVKAPDAPAPLGTNLKGDGPGLSGLGGGNGLGGGTLGTGNNTSGGSRFGWYAGQVQAKISDALRRDPKTRNTSMRLTVRIWPDATGRITRAQLIGSTGDSALDSTIQNNVLTGLQLQEPPPVGMKLPINLRLTAQRPR